MDSFDKVDAFYKRYWETEKKGGGAPTRKQRKALGSHPSLGRFLICFAPNASTIQPLGRHYSMRITNISNGDLK
jgi:hypothetical protein